MKNLLLPLLLLFTFVFSCTDEDEETFAKTVTSYDVYVAGMENYKACYWKNNIKINLPSTDSTAASKIIVKNNVSHILGSTLTFPNKKFYYWQNNIQQDLSQYLSIPSGSFYVILDMAIDNGDNYFIGYYDTFSSIPNEKYEFCMWKNGVKTTLNKYQNIIYQSSKLNIFNHQPYISAVINDGTSFQSGYYINSTFYSIPNINWVANFTENANGINFLYIKDGKYYYRQLSNNTDIIVDNNLFLPNLNFGKIVSETNSIDLYVIGNFQLNNFYYKNNIQTTFPLDPNYASIKDIFVLDNNIYIIKENPAPYASKVYINNVETQSLANNGNFANTFNSIFVVQN